MKQLILISAIFVSLQSSALASDCREKIISEASPNDRLESLYQCQLSQTEVGSPDDSYDSLCYGSYKDQYSGFQSTWFKTYRYNEGLAGGYLTIVVQKASGQVSDGYVKQSPSLLILGSTDHTSGTTGQKWIEETVVALSSPWAIVFKTYKKGWLGNKLTSAATYTCQRLL